jgi:hypothetical protein
MYERVFDTGWDEVSYEEALRRMYVLGVATGLDHPIPEEYDRLRRQASTSYARSVLELSFKEGKQRARADRSGSGADEEIWQSLVDEAGAGIPDSAPDPGRDRGPKSGVPAAVARAPFLERDSYEDELARVRLPDLLRWEE